MVVRSHYRFLPKKAGNITFLQAASSPRPVISPAQPAADRRRKPATLIREISISLLSALSNRLMFRKSAPSRAFFHPQTEDNTVKTTKPRWPKYPNSFVDLSSIAAQMPPQPPFTPPARARCGGVRSHHSLNPTFLTTQTGRRACVNEEGTRSGANFCRMIRYVLGLFQRLWAPW